MAKVQMKAIAMKASRVREREALCDASFITAGLCPQTESVTASDSTVNL